MPHVLFVFLDGVGLGEADPAANPLAALALPALERLAGGQRWTADARPQAAPERLFHAIDANLGVEGLPQSGTGQATLFTGVNCARLVGRHFGPFPHSQTKPVLAAENVFRKVQHLGLPLAEPVAFANAYPPRFFALARHRNRWTVTTRCCLDAGVPIRDAAALAAGRALAADLTGRGWREGLGMDVDPIPEALAGERLARLSRAHAFTLFEYYLTDKAGHSRSPQQAALVLESLDRFFTGLLDALDPADTLLVVTSDHGNLEDLTTKSHTRNPVPLIARGPGAARFAAVRDLTEVTPAVVDVLRDGLRQGAG